MDSQTAYNQLQAARSSARSASDLYGEAQQSTGATAAQSRTNDLRGTIRNTEQALRGVEGSVTGRTQGSLVSEAQRSRLASLERAPIAQQFSDQQGALSDEEALYQKLVGEAGNRAGLEYQSQSDRIKGLETDYSSALSREEAARQAAFEQQQFAESQRQFNAKLAADNSAAKKNTYDVDSLIKQIMGSQAPVSAGIDWNKILGAVGNTPAPAAKKSSGGVKLPSIPNSVKNGAKSVVLSFLGNTNPLIGAGAKLLGGFF